MGRCSHKGWRGACLALVLAICGTSVHAAPADDALNQFYMLKADKPAEARAALAKAARRFPQDERIQLEWAYTLLNEKKPRQAYDAFMLAAQQKPQDGALQRQIGFTALQAGLEKEGRAAFERALAIDPKDELARNQIAFMLDTEGRHRSARDEFKQLLNSSDPERRLRACEAFGNLRTSVNRL
jgi:Tfp pilus assembly protein PilF